VTDHKRVIFTGGRDDGVAMAGVITIMLRGLAETYGDRLVVVHGGARGVDTAVDGIARGLGLVPEPHPAAWTNLGRAAGHVRNQHMLDLGASLVLAFKRGFNWRLDRGGTEDMVRRAMQAGVPTFVVQQA
jgi:hypothetical protein